MLLSDFLFEADYTKQLKSVAAKHDLVALQIRDPAEQQLPAVGHVRIEDPETGEQIEVNTSSPRVRVRYAKAAKEWQEQVEQSFKQLQIDHVKLKTNEDYLPAMQRFFKGRGSPV